MDLTPEACSRPVRKRKPRNFDDYHMFENEGKSFVTSTPKVQITNANTASKTPQRGSPRKLSEDSEGITTAIRDSITENDEHDAEKSKTSTVDNISVKESVIDNSPSSSGRQGRAKRGRSRKSSNSQDIVPVNSDKFRTLNEHENKLKGTPNNGKNSRLGNVSKLSHSHVASDDDIKNKSNFVDDGRSVKKRGRPRKFGSIAVSNDEDKSSKNDSSKPSLEILKDTRKRGRPKKKLNDSDLSNCCDQFTDEHLNDSVVEGDGQKQCTESTSEDNIEKSMTNSIDNDTYESRMLRKKGAKRKNVSDHDDTDASLETGQSSSAGQKRRKVQMQNSANNRNGDQHGGKSSKNENKDLGEDADSEAQKIGLNDITESQGNGKAETLENKAVSNALITTSETVTQPTPKRRGRPPSAIKILPSTGPAEPVNLPKVTVPPNAPVTVCRNCGVNQKNPAALKMHMMVVHSLVWEKNNPQGQNLPAAVIKKLGYIDCPRCQKRFKFPQYYKHHEIWCGKEDEMATCEICKKTMRAMWLQQHLRAHKTEEKQQQLLEEEEKKKANNEGDNAEQQDETSNDNKAVTGRRGQRQAAKSAIKLLSGLQDSKDNAGDKDSSGDEFKDSSGSESSEDDDSDEGEDEQEDISEASGTETDDVSSTPVTKKKQSKQTKKAPREDKLSLVSEAPVCDWELACDMGATSTDAERLQQLHDFYSSQAEGRLFPDLAPRLKNWRPVDESEREKYVPGGSLSFTCGCDRAASTPCKIGASLKWGQTATCNGRSYLHAGGPIWAVEWCPLPQGAGHDQIVAVVADLTTEEHPDTHITMAGPGLIQIWSMGHLKNTERSQAKPVLQYSIAHNSGYVRSLSWCPTQCFDQKEETNSECMKRLGLLAVACSEGKVMVYSVPQPSTLQHNTNDEGDQDQHVIYQPQSSLTLVTSTMKGCGPCLCVSWQQGGQHKYIIGGFGHGVVFLWDLMTTSTLLRIDSSTLRPLRSFLHHTSAVLSCVWDPRNASVFATSSFDHKICMWDAERFQYPISIMSQFRAIFMHRTLCWAGPMHPCFFSTCEKLFQTNKCWLMFHGLAKTAVDSVGSGMFITLPYHSACVWDVTFCPFYEVLVSCDAVGKVKVIMPPMKTLRFHKIRKNSRPLWHESFCPFADLYQAKIKKNKKAQLSSTSSSPLKPPTTTDQNGPHSTSAASQSLTAGKDGRSKKISVQSVDIPLHPNENKVSQTTKSGSRALNGDKRNKDEMSDREVNVSGRPKKPTTGASEGEQSDGNCKSADNGDEVKEVLSASDEDVLHFQDCQMTKTRLKPGKDQPRGKCEVEDFGGDNTHAIHRVRLSPNPSCCLWLASGGHSGLLRLDNLTELVQPNAVMVKQFYAAHKNYTS